MPYEIWSEIIIKAASDSVYYPLKAHSHKLETVSPSNKRPTIPFSNFPNTDILTEEKEVLLLPW